MKRREWKGSYAVSGDDGLKLLANERFDVVVADMRMPCMKGADFFDRVQREQPNTLRVVLSGHSDMQCLLKTSTTLAHQFLSKPCTSKTLIETLQRLLDMDDILNDKASKSVILRMKSLPVIPEVYYNIQKCLEDSDPDLKRIGRLVEKDVGLSANLLKVVNSPYFGFYERVISPAHAVVLLGIDALKGLILGVKLLGNMESTGVPGYSVEKLWKHSLQTGYFAKAIAESEQMDKEFVESCFVCGMLHDLGKFVLLTELAEAYGPLLELAKIEGGPVNRIEQQELKVGHAEIGAYLLGTWGFKSEIVRGVYRHHSPINDTKEITIALIVHVADVLQHELAVWNTEYVPTVMEQVLLEDLEWAQRLDAWRDVCKTFLREEENEENHVGS